MRLPAWLSLTCAAMVILWGVYRIRVGLRSRAAEARAAEKKGLFAMPRRTHLLIGTLYVMLGIGLIAVTFGWNPIPPSKPAQDRGGGDGGGGGEAIEVETRPGTENPK